MASVLYVANTTEQAVAANGLINLGSIIRKTCNSQAELTNNSVALTGTGYFAIDVAATFVAPAAGNVVLQLYKDGVAVPGAIATETISDANTEFRSVAFTVEVRNVCCNNYSVLTLINTGVVAQYSNIAVRVKRDA